MPGPPQGMTSPRVIGTGWTTVVVADVPTTSGQQDGSGPGSLRGVLERLPRVQGSWGAGRLLQGTLFSAILTDNGKLAVGAVAPATLEQALSRR